MSLSAPTNVVAGYDLSNNLYRITWTPVAGLYAGDNYEVTINGATHIVNPAASGFVYRGAGDNKMIHEYGGPRIGRFVTSSGKIVNGNFSGEFVDTPLINWTTKKARKGFAYNGGSFFLLDDNTLWSGGNDNNNPSQVSTTELGSSVITDFTVTPTVYAIITDTGKVMTRGSNATLLGSGSSSTRSTFGDVSGIDWTTKKAISLCSNYYDGALSILLDDGTVYLLGNSFTVNFLPYKIPDFDGVSKKVVDFKILNAGNMQIALLDNGRIMTKGNSDLTLGRGQGASGATFDYVSGVDGVNVKATKLFISDGEYNRWWGFTTESGVAYVVGDGTVIGNDGIHAYTPVPYSVQFPNNRVVQFSGGGYGGSSFEDHMFAILEDGSVYGSGRNNVSMFGSSYTNGALFSTPVLVRPSSVNNTAINPADTYTITVATKRLATQKSTATTATVGIMPANPILTATRASATSITLNWTADPGTFQIYRVGSTVPIATTTLTTYTVSNLPQQETYSYYISTSNQYGIVTSNTVTMYLPTDQQFAGYTSAPSNLIAGYDASNNSYKLKWTAPARYTNENVYELTVNSGSARYINGDLTQYEYVGDGGDKHIQIAAGPYHTLYLMESGKVKGLGWNGSRQLNPSNTTNYLVPTDISGIDWSTKKALAIAAGLTTTFILLNDGTMAYLGRSSTTVRYIDLSPLGGRNIVDMKCSTNYVALLLEDGRVWAAGTNGYNAQGTGTADSDTILRLVKGIDWTTNNAVSISTSQYIMYIVMSSGQVYYTGYNVDNYLGITNSNPNAVAVRITEIDGSNNKVVKAVNVSYRASYFLLNTGRIIVAGQNTNGVLGIGNLNTNSTATVGSFTYMANIDGVNMRAIDIITANNADAEYAIIKMANGEYYGVGRIGAITGTGYVTSIQKLYSANDGVLDIGMLYEAIIVAYNNGTVIARGISTYNSLGNYSDNTTISNASLAVSTAVTTPVSSSTSYTFGLKRISFNTTTQINSSSSVSTVGGNLPLIPSSFTASQTSGRALTLTWTAPQYADSYVVTTPTGQLTTTATSLDISDLSELQTYNYSLFARNAYGDGYPTTTSITMSSELPKLTAISISGDSVAVDWNHLTNADSYSLTVKQYTLQYPLARITSSTSISFAFDDKNLGSVGSSVTSWASRVGSSIFTPYSTFTAPIVGIDIVSGRKVVRFDGKSGLQHNISYGNSNKTMIIVAKTNTNKCKRVVFDTVRDVYYGWNNNNTNITYGENNQGGAGAGTAIPTDTNWRVFTINFATGYGQNERLTMRIGGIKYTSPGTNNPFIYTSTLGLGANTQCDIAAIYFWDRILSDAEQLSYEYQLVQKYKIPTATWNSAGLVTDLPVLAQTTATASSSDRSATLTVPFNINYTEYKAELYGTTASVNSTIDNAWQSAMDGFIRPPTQPLSVIATPYENRAVITWSPPESDGGLGITSYTVTATPGNASVTVVGTASTATVSGLTNGESYTFAVTAANFIGTGDVAVSNTVVPNKTVPFAPTNVTANLTVDGDIEVRWLPNADNGGYPVTSYRITTVPATQTIDISGWGARYAKITNAAAATSYTVNVVAINSLGMSLAGSTTITSVSGSSGNTTIVPGDISGVSNLRAGYDSSNNNYIIKWTPPSANVTGYELRMNNGSSISLNNNDNTYIFNGEGGDRVINIYTAVSHTIYRYASGKLRGVGYGRGINGTTVYLSEFIDVAGIDWTARRAVDVAIASEFTAILLDDGTLQVHNDGAIQNWSLAPLGGAKIVQMSAGNNCVAVLLDNGKVMVRGTNSRGRLGVGNTNTINTFTDVSGINWSIEKAAYVYLHQDTDQTYIVMRDGSLYMAGNHPANGMLGLTPNTNYTSATAVPGFGTTYLASKVIMSPWTVDNIFVLLKNGRVLVRGSNAYKELGIGNSTSTVNTWTYMLDIDGITLSVADLISSHRHLVMRMTNGDIYGTGQTYYIGGNIEAERPTLIYTAISGKASVLSANGFFNYHRIDSSGNVYVYGYNYNGVIGIGDIYTWQWNEVNTVSPTTPLLSVDPLNKSMYGFTLTVVSANVRSSAVSATVGDLPGKPTNVSVQSNGSGTLRSTWIVAQGIVSSYNVYANGILKGSTTNTIFDVSGLDNLSNNIITVEAVNQYGENIGTGVSSIVISAMNGLYYRYNDISNVYTLLWDNQAKIAPYYNVQLTINGANQLAPSTVYDGYVFNGSSAKPIRIVNNTANLSAILMSDGTVKVYGGGSVYNSITGSNTGYATIPGLTGVVSVFFIGSDLIFGHADGTCRRLTNNTISVIPNIVNAVTGNESYIVTIDNKVYNTNGVLQSVWYRNTDGSSMTISTKFFGKRGYGSPQNLYAISTDGKLFSRSNSGSNDFYGRPDYNSQYDYFLIQDISNVRVKTVATGQSRSAVVLEDGRVMTCGANNAANIGRPASVSATPNNRFHFLSGISNAVDVTCNDNVTLILLSNGRVLGFGTNNGSLLSASALNDTVTTPTDLGLSNIISIDSSRTGIYFVHADGRVLVAGNGNGWSFPITTNPGNSYSTLQLANGTSAAANTLTVGTTYAISSRYYFNDAFRSSAVSAEPAPLQQTDSIDLSVVAAGSAIVRIGSTVVTVPVVSSIVEVENNAPAIITDPRISATPIVAFVAKPATEADLGSSLRTGAEAGFNNIVVQQTVAGQTVTSLVKPQSSAVAEPLTMSDSAGTTARFTTSSAGTGNIVAASVQGVDTSNNYVSVFMKVVNSAGQVQQSGFSVPLEIDLPSAETRDTLTIRRFNATTGSFEDAGIMTKKAGTTSTFVYTFTTNSYYTVVPCILGHTKVMTPRGPIAAAFLKVGDNVLTNDGRQVAIKQIYTSAYKTTKETAPYRFKKGCIGGVYPAKDFEVSPTHAVAVPGGWVIPKHAALSGIKAEQVMVGEKVNYFHIELENYLRDNLVLEGGAVVESFGVNWLRGQPKGTVVYTFDHATKLFHRPAYVAKRKTAGKA